MKIVYNKIGHALQIKVMKLRNVHFLTLRMAKFHAMLYTFKVIINYYYFSIKTKYIKDVFN